MYRQYEDPRSLEEQLERLEAKLYEAQLDGEDDDYLYLAIHELKDRINFAWQDDEYDAMEV